MKKVLIVLVLTLLFVLEEGFRDAGLWGNVNHGYSLGIRVAVLTVLSLYIRSAWPFFIFFALFDPVIAKIRDLDFFYIGHTAKYDLFIRDLFGENAGVISFISELYAGAYLFLRSTKMGAFSSNIPALLIVVAVFVIALGLSLWNPFNLSDVWQAVYALGCMAGMLIFFIKASSTKKKK